MPVRSGSQIVLADVYAQNLLFLQPTQVRHVKLSFHGYVQLAPTATIPVFLEYQLAFRPLSTVQNFLLEGTGTQTNAYALLRCKNAGALPVGRESQRSCIKVNADVFEHNLRQRLPFVHGELGIVAQKALVHRGHGANGIAGQLRSQFGDGLANLVVGLVVQVVTLPKTLLPLLVLPNDARQEIAGLPERVLSGLQFLVGFGIHFQDDTSRPHVRGAADELTGVL